LASAAILSGTSSNAATITAYELITDTITGDNDSRSFTRERYNGSSGTPSPSSSDIISQNDIDTDFGKYNDNQVDYTHHLSWLTHGTLTGAILEIGARRANNEVDKVYIDIRRGQDIFLGTLTTGIGTGIITSIISIDVNYLANGVLDLLIKKSDDDRIEIVSSKLSVTWETAPSPTNRVPDGGATLALLGFGLMGMAACSRKLGSKKN